MKKIKKTKLINAILILCIILGCCGCGAEAGRKDEGRMLPQKERSTLEDEMPITDEVDSASTSGSDEIPDEVDSASTSDSDEIPVVDKWEVTTINNNIPITPEGYEGDVVTILKSYTGKDGVTIDKEYHDVAFLDKEDKADYEYDYKWYTDVEIDGERMSGNIMYNTEKMRFLEHHNGENVQRFFLDINLPKDIDYMSLIGRNEKVALISGGSYIFTYDFGSKECRIITDSALDYNYPVLDTLYFTDWDHCEYQCNWNESNSVSKTGNSGVVRYLNYSGITKREDFQKEFLEMQEKAKTGNVSDDNLSDKYYIWCGSIYSENEEYMGNIHLPYATERSSKIWYPDSYSCWLIEDNSITRYRYGVAVNKHELPEGDWYIIGTYDSLKMYENELYVKYDLDINHDGVISAEELYERTLSLDTLLMDNSTRTVYHLDIEGNLTEVAKNVQDYCEAYGAFYWMDSNLNAYVLSWCEKDESVLIGENVVGISPYEDECAGFIVKPGDPRATCVINGFSICTESE